MSNEPMESHGLRLRPQVWRQIERLAEKSGKDRSDWLRQQIEALLMRADDMHTVQANMHRNAHDGDLSEVFK